MPTIHVEAQVSTEQLLRAVEQMPVHELDAFVSRVLALRAQREAPNLPLEESELLLKINHPIPPDLQQHYIELIAKRRAETLTPAEHTELLHLTDQVEQLESGRVAALAALVQLRLTILDEPALPLDTARGPQMSTIFEQLAAIHALADLTDPAQWERDIHQDRPLPEREP